MIGNKNTISGGSSIMWPIRIPENTRNGILLMFFMLKSMNDFIMYRPLAYNCVLRFGLRAEINVYKKTACVVCERLSFVLFCYDRLCRASVSSCKRALRTRI